MSEGEAVRPLATLGHIRLIFKAYREDAQWVSECIELGTGSCGDTVEGAFDALSEATLLFLETLEEQGERDRVFRERDIRITPGEPTSAEEEIHVRARPHEVVSLAEIKIPVGVA